MKVLKRVIALVMALSLVLGLLTLGVSADVGYTTPDTSALDSKYDPNSNVYLVMKEGGYNEETGVLTITVGGQLSNMGIAESSKPIGWNTMAFVISFDNTKLSIVDDMSFTYGGSDIPNSTAVEYGPFSADFLLKSGVIRGANVAPTGSAYETVDYLFYKNNDRTALYLTATPGTNKVPYGQSYEIPTDLVNITFLVANDPETGKPYALEDLDTFFNKDTIRFVNWNKAEDVAAAGVFDNLGASVQYTMYNASTSGAMRWHSAIDADVITEESVVKLMQATVNYPGVDNVTPGSLSGDMVADAVAYNKIGAVEIPVTAPTLLDTDDDPISGGNYNITYTVSDNGGENFADVTYANGKITVPADFVKAYVAADTPVVITVTAQLDGYDSIKLTDTVTVNVAASAADSISGADSIVLGQSETYKVIDQYGFEMAGAAITMEGALTGVSFANNTLTAEKIAATGSVTLKCGSAAKTVSVSELAIVGANKPSVDEDVTYGDYTDLADAVNAPATLTLTNGHVASNPVVKFNKAGVDAGTYAVTVEYQTDVPGVTFTYGPMDLVVAKRPVTIDSVVVDEKGYSASKTYDGTVDYVGTLELVLGNVVPGDDVTATTSEIKFASNEFGADKKITFDNAELSGAKSENYEFKDGINYGESYTGLIRKKGISVKVVEPYEITKVYDGNANATVPAGVFVFDDLALANVDKSENPVVAFDSAVYADANVGEDKGITVSGFSFADKKIGSNYDILTEKINLVGDITAKEITPVLNASNKVADGTAVVKNYSVSFTGLVDGDTLIEGTDYTVDIAFKGTTVGTQGVEGNITLQNTTAAKNYKLSTSELVDADAEIVNLYLADEPELKAGPFAYGETKYSDLITLPSMSGLIAGVDAADAVKFDITAFDSENNKVFEAKDLTALPTDFVEVAVDEVVVTFYDASNNAVESKPLTGFTVDRKALTVSASGDISKEYDGDNTVDDTVTLTLGGKVTGDDVSASYTDATYADKDAGTGKTVTVNGITLSGDDAYNYTVDTSCTLTGTITPKELTVTASGDISKEYDGDNTVDDTVTLALSDMVTGDDVSATYTDATYDNANAGTGKIVTVNGITLTGDDAGNYTVDTSCTLTGEITKAPITATLTVANKVWDGTDKAFEYDVSFEYANNNAVSLTEGTDYTVSGVKFDGTDVGATGTGSVELKNGNYILNPTVFDGVITKNPSAEVSFATKTAADGTVTFVVKVTVEDEEGNTVTVNDPEYTASPAAPKPGDEVTVTVTGNDNYAGATSEGLIYYGGLAVFFLCSDEDLADINDAATVFDIENVKSALASALVDESGNDAHVKVAAQVLSVEKDDDGVIESVNLVVFTTRAVDSTGAQHITELDDELIIKLNVPASVDKAYAKVEVAGSSEYIELDEGEDVLTLTIEDTKMSSPYAIEFTDDDGSSDDAIVGPAVLVYTTAKPGGVVNPQMKYVAKGGSTYITIAPNPGNTIDTIKINGVVVNYKDMLVGPNEAGLYHLRLTNLNRDAYIEVSFKLKSQIVWQNPFTDVKPTDWFYSSVEFASIHGLFNGTSATTFSPEEPMTRAMLVTVLHRLEGGPVMYSKASFKDVPVGKYYTDAVAWASNVGIVTGYTDGTFDPDGLVTREQMAAILWRYAKYKGYDVSVGENTNILSYDDAFSVSEYAIPAMQWACGSGIINGVTPSTLQPKANATRAVVATILMRFCNYYLV